LDRNSDLISEGLYTRIYAVEGQQMELVCTKQGNVSRKLVSNNFRIHLSTSRSGYC